MQPRLVPPEQEARTLGRSAAAAVKQLQPGDLAALKRHSPNEPPAPAFWRIWADLLVPHLPPEGAPRDLYERRWGTVLTALARVHGLGESAPLGRALAEADFSELRFSRLLRASGEALDDAVRHAAAFLASKGKSADAGDFARLVLIPDADDGERVRRSIARSYYQHTLSKKES